MVGGGEECVGFCCNQLDGAHSLDYPIHFHYFGSLRHLKISHIGVQLLQDMFILRDQLESLTIHSCHSDEFHMQVGCFQPVFAPTISWFCLLI